MTITNHAVTGALVAAAINKPWLSLPAALLSHFVIDVIPHWDYKVPGGIKIRNLAIAADFSMALYVLLVLAISVDVPPRLIIAGGVLAILPDLMWARYRDVDFPTKFPKKTAMDRLRALHQKIQLSETAWGKYVEIGWFVLMVILIFQV